VKSIRTVIRWERVSCSVKNKLSACYTIAVTSNRSAKKRLSALIPRRVLIAEHHIRDLAIFVGKRRDLPRAHFLVLLTPSALERCGDPGDWLRREIEAALDSRRNIVPLMMEGFDFGTPTIANQLTGKLALLNHYNALEVRPAYVFEAMSRLREKYLNVALDAVPRPASLVAQHAATEQKDAAATASPVSKEELTAQQWFERGFNTRDLDEKLRFYSEAVRLQPNVALAFYNRGGTRMAKGDLVGALADYNEAIRLRSSDADAFNNRGFVHYKTGDLDSALADYTRAIRLKPDLASAFNNRGCARHDKGDLVGALADCNAAIRLKPDFAEAFDSRGNVRRAQGDLEGALADYNRSVSLRPDYSPALDNRELVLRAIAARSKS